MAKAKKKTAGKSVLESLRKASAGDKTSGSRPSIELTTKAATALSAVMENKKLLKRAEAAIAESEPIVWLEAKPARIEACRSRSEMFPSVYLTGEDDNGDEVKATFIQQGRFCNMVEPQDKGIADKLKALFTNKFDKYFKVSLGVTTTSEFTEEDAIKMIKALGDRASEVLILTESVVPTEALVTDMVMEPAIEKKVEKAQNDHGLVVPFKPSLRAPTKSQK